MPLVLSKFLIMMSILSLPACAELFQMQVWSVESSAVKSTSATFALNATIKKDVSSALMQGMPFKIWGGIYPLRQKNVCMAPILMYLLH